MRLLVILFLLIATPAWATNWCNQSVGCFLMEGDADGDETDQSPYGNDLSVEASDTIPSSSDTPASYSTGSRDFESTDYDRMTHADGLSTDISGAEQDFTLVAWVKPESITTTTNQILAKYSWSTNERQYALNVFSEDTFSVWTSSAGTSGITCEGATVPDMDTWYHVAGVHDAADDEMRIYVNGVLDSNGADNPKAHTGGVFDGDVSLRIGAQYESGAEWDGLLDEIAIFGLDLSATDINDIMDNGLLQSATTKLYGLTVGGATLN